MNTPTITTLSLALPDRPRLVRCPTKEAVSETKRYNLGEISPLNLSDRFNQTYLTQQIPLSNEEMDFILLVAMTYKEQELIRMMEE